MGRPAEDMPNLTARICGVCPEAHHLAATKALDDLFHVDPPPAAKKLRELFYSIFYATDHTTHFYALGGPDFVVGPTAPAAQRNILGVVAKVGMDVAGKVLKMRRDGHELIKMMGGRRVHPNWGLPGGVSRGINEEQRKEIEARGREAVEFAKFSLQVFQDVVLKNSDYVKLITGDIYVHRTYNMGTVDENNYVNFYDGKIRVVGPDGREHAKYDARDYQEYVAERVEPWTYLKFPYLKKVGWKGLVDGVDSGVYKATPLSRLNAADGMATPLAQAEYEKFYDALGGKPVHHTLATHWARLIELLYAAEHWLELAGDPEITSERIPDPAHADADRGRGLRRGPAGDPHAPLHDRRARHPHESQPGRRHDEQQRPHLHVREEGGPGPDRQRQGRERRAAEHGGDGLPGLRSVLRLRHPQLARPDAAGGRSAGPARAGRATVRVSYGRICRTVGPSSRRTRTWFRPKCCDVSIVSRPSARRASKPWPRSPREESVAAGRQVFGEGDPADTLSLIVDGEVDIRYLLGSGESRVVDTLIAGDILGWSALVEPHKMTGIATTRKPTRLIRIQARPLRELCERDPLLGYRLAIQVVRLLADRLEATRAQLATAD